MAIFGQTIVVQVTWLSIRLKYQPMLLSLSLVSICAI